LTGVNHIRAAEKINCPIFLVFRSVFFVAASGEYVDDTDCRALNTNQVSEDSEILRNLGIIYYFRGPDMVDTSQ